MTTLTLQPDETSGVDTYLDDDVPAGNYGNSSIIAIGETNVAVAVRRALIRFDLSSIPSNAIISSATLYMTIQADRSSNARDFKVYRSLRPWVEGEASWNVWSTGNNWTVAGSGGDGTDADLLTVWATTNFSAAEPVDTEKSWSLNVTEFTKLVNGTYNNYGFLIKADTEANDAYLFYSSGEAVSSKRPKLVVVYTLPETSGVTSVIII